MRRPLLVGVFALILATEMCSDSECQPAHCEDHDLGTGTLGLDPTKTLEFLAEDCNTCTHATLKATWRFAANHTGNFTFIVTAGCTNTAGIGQADVMSFAANLGKADFQPSNIKNLCGDRAPMKYAVTAVNESNQRLDSVSVVITCPHDPNPASPVAPSPAAGVRIR